MSDEVMKKYVNERKNNHSYVVIHAIVMEILAKKPLGAH